MRATYTRVYTVIKFTMSLLVTEEDDICRQAEIQLKNMPLSVVRLSFRAYLHDSNGVCMRVLPPVISNPIYDSSMSLTLFFFVARSHVKLCRVQSVLV